MSTNISQSEPDRSVTAARSAKQLATDELRSRVPQARKAGSTSASTSSEGRTPDQRSTSVSQTQGMPNTSTSKLPESLTETRLTQPDWYRKAKKLQTRNKYNLLGTDAKLRQLKERVLKSEEMTKTPSPIEILHDAMSMEVSAQLVRDNRLLHDNVGLPKLFAQGSRMPYYVKLDAEELYHKWCAQLFKPDIMHGIKVEKDSSHSIIKHYAQRKYGNKHGNNGLVNGQWWPLQLCTVRDGAHHSAQGGISGKEGKGAWSVILSSGEIEGGGKYPDEDHGDRVLYCGTDSKTSEPSDNTKRLLENCESNKPVRLIRSSKCHELTYRPKAGLRYDGLYDITNWTILDCSKQRYRFTLLRQANQDPIRSAGAAKRPSPQELAAWKKLKEEKKYLA